MKRGNRFICIFSLCLCFLAISAVEVYPWSLNLTGLRSWDFDRLAEGGFGDSANSYAWSVTMFNGDLYVGTNRHHMWSLMQSMSGMMPPMPPGFGPEGPANETWGNMTWAQDFRGQIWRYRDGAWSLVHLSPVVYGELPIAPNPTLPPPPNPPIVGHYPESYGYRTMGVYNGYIYAIGIGTWVPNMPLARITRSPSGDEGTWEDVSGIISTATNPRGLVTYKGNLYITASLPGTAPAGAGIGLVYRYDPKTQGLWVQVSDPGFGNIDNAEIAYLTEFNGYLYASTVNYNTGFEVWKTNGKLRPDGKYTWKRIIKEGFGDTYNQWGMTMTPFMNHLYIGTAAGAGMVLKNGRPVGRRAFDLIRLNKNDQAKLLVGSYEPDDPPEGWPAQRVPLSRWAAGFGNPYNDYVWHMCVHESWLYLATYDETSHILLMAQGALAGGLNPGGVLPLPILQLRQGLDEMDISRYAPQQRNAVIALKSALDSRDVSAAGFYISQMLDLFGGADLWKSLNGVHWFPVTINGFDNHLNFGFRRLVSVHEPDLWGLVLGTANAFTGHPEGGCEILLGTNPYTIGPDRRR